MCASEVSQQKAPNQSFQQIPRCDDTSPSLVQLSNEASSPHVEPSTSSSPVQPSNEASSSPVQPSNEANSSPVQPSNESTSPLVEPSNEASSSPVKPSNEANSSPVQPSNESTSSPVEPSNESTSPLVKPSNEASLLLVQPSNEGSSSHIQLSNETSVSSVQLRKKTVVRRKKTKDDTSHFLNQASFRDVLSFHRIPLLLRVCVAMIALLLLLAGDVERNPGPTVVTEDNVDELAALITDVAANWSLFLGQLEVPKAKRDQLREENAGRPRAAQKCLIEGLHYWVVSNEKPMYETIVNVLNSDFLINKPLAKKVEEFAKSVNTGVRSEPASHLPLSSEVPWQALPPPSAPSAGISRKRASNSPTPEPLTKRPRADSPTGALLGVASPQSASIGIGHNSQPSPSHSPSPQAGNSRVSPLLYNPINTASGPAEMDAASYDYRTPNAYSTAPSFSGQPPPPSTSYSHPLPSMSSNPQPYQHNVGNYTHQQLLPQSQFSPSSAGVRFQPASHLPGASWQPLQPPSAPSAGVSRKRPSNCYTPGPLTKRPRAHPSTGPQLGVASPRPASVGTGHDPQPSPSHTPSPQVKGNQPYYPLTQSPGQSSSLSDSIIQKQPSHQQQSLLPASTTDDVVSVYADKMKGYYRTTIPQFFTLTWPPPPTRKVFNLSMISQTHTHNYGRGNDELVRLLYRGSVDKVLEKKKKSVVELKDLFHLDQAERKFVLIEGAPGAGKSTLAWHICQQWKSGELFQEFRLVVFVQLRDPAIQSAKSLVDILPVVDFGSMEQVVSQIQLSCGSGVLFVLDGWDEFPEGLGGNKFFNHLICNPSSVGMPSSTLLITSRPIASGELHQYASSRVETIGFKQAELQLYFKEAMLSDSDKIQELEDCLKERPIIKASCYLPLNASIVVHLFLALGDSLLSTLHGVFLQLVIHCIVRHIMREQGGSGEAPHISSLEDLPPDMQTQLNNICTMAYHGVMNKKVTFSEADLKSFNLPTDISTLSLIQVVVSFMPYRSRSYNFLHLSVQELLTAYHISKLPPEEQVKIFSELFGQSRFAAVFQYYAAFTKLQIPGIRKIITSMMCKKTKVLRLTLLQCLYEAQDTLLCQFVASELKGELDLSNKSLSPVDCISVGYFLHQCAACYPMTAKLSKCSLDSYKLELLWKELKRPTQAAGFAVGIDLSSSKADGNLTQCIATHLIASGSEDGSSAIISKLDLSDNPIQDGEDGLSHLCQALTTNTSLVELNLSNCRLSITEKNGKALSDMLKTNKTLKLLMLLPIARIDGHGLRYFSEYINSSLHTISKLDLSNNSIQDGEDGLSHLCHALATNTSLVELNLSNCSLHETCGPALCHMLETNRTLTSFNLSENYNLSDNSVARIAKGLRSNHSLKRLKIRRCRTGVKSLIVCLSVNDSLEELDLSGNTISHETACGFFDMLKRNSTLRKLNVSQCELTEEAVKSLASALEVNSTLEELDLSDNTISHEAAYGLSDMFKRNSTLKKLSV